MKCIKRSIAILSLAFMTITGCANNGNNNPQGLAFLLQNDGTYAVNIGDAVLLDEIVIPSTYYGKKVTRIVDYFNCGGEFNPVASNFKRITIPKTIKSIGKGALFYDLESIKYQGKSSEFDTIDFSENWLGVSDGKNDGPDFVFKDTKFRLTRDSFDVIKYRQHNFDTNEETLSSQIVFQVNTITNMTFNAATSKLQKISYDFRPENFRIKDETIVTFQEGQSSSAVKALKTGTTEIEVSIGQNKTTFPVTVI